MGLGYLAKSIAHGFEKGEALGMGSAQHMNIGSGVDRLLMVHQYLILIVHNSLTPFSCKV